MCGVIGVALEHPTNEQLEMIRRVFLESRIRGMHATGISYISAGKIVTIKEPINSIEFVDRHMSDMGKFVNAGWITLIGHCRYSTSDLEFNQPIADEELSIVHNGVISQELPENWKQLYGHDCETRNDTELMFHTIKEGKRPIEEWLDSSISAVELRSNGTLKYYRNGKRPLYLTEANNGIIIASTKNILERAGAQNTVKVDYPDGKDYQDVVYI